MADVAAKQDDKMKGELKKRARQVEPIGFPAPGMPESTRDQKHGD